MAVAVDDNPKSFYARITVWRDSPENYATYMHYEDKWLLIEGSSPFPTYTHEELERIWEVYEQYYDAKVDVAVATREVERLRKILEEM